MKKLWVLVLFIGLTVQLKAQETTTYYLNEREIAPQSFYFLNPGDIDSLKVRVNSVPLL